MRCAPFKLLGSGADLGGLLLHLYAKSVQTTGGGGARDGGGGAGDGGEGLLEG